MPKLRVNGVTDNQIISEYNLDHSIQRVGKKLGIGDATIHRVLVKHGVDRSGLQEYRATMAAPKTEPYIGVYQGSKEEILEMYESGLSMREIANRIGRSTTVVIRRIKEAGISRRGRGPLHNMWTGGKIATGNGYLKQWISEDDPMACMRGKGGYVKEHRLNLARKIGRPLLLSESVHHVDGDQLNNKPSNLELRQGQHGRGVVMCCMNCGSRNIGHTTLGESEIV